MKTLTLLRFGSMTGLLWLGASLKLAAQVPQLLHYQGRAIVANTNFEGTGQFKFALVNADGSATYWSNDSTSVEGSEPTAAVSLPVTKGLYAVLLGDTALPNMTVVPATVFAHSDVRLRVWFNGGAGFQLLAPDQRIAAVGYAMVAANVPDGAITAAKLANGEVVKTLNSLKDNVNLVAGANVTITPNGNNLEIAASGGGAGGISGNDGAGLTNLQVTSLTTHLSHVIGWGENANGQSTAPAGLSNVIALAAGESHSLALKADGTVVAWGLDLAGETEVPAGLNNVVAVTAGRHHSLALKSDGTVVAWGSNYYDETSIPPGLNNVAAVAAAGYYSLALKKDGTLVLWGYFGNFQVPAGLDHVAAIAAGAGHCLALKNDGTVVAWGDNTSGQTSVPTGLSGVIAVAAGDAHSLALKSDGTVVNWGASGPLTVPPGLNSITAIAAGHGFSLALKSDGTVVAWGLAGNAGSDVTVMPPTANHVVAVAAGYLHGLAVRTGSEPAQLPLLDVPNSFTGANFFQGPSVFTGMSTFNNPANRFTGNGEGLTGLNAACLLPGQVVKSLNSLKDNVSLTAGQNISITPNGNSLQIATSALAPAGTPQVGAVVTATDTTGNATWENGMRVVSVSRVTGFGQQATSSRNLIAGQNNAVEAGVLGATVLGGGFEQQNSAGNRVATSSNYVSGDYGAVIGGAGNSALNSYATVSGGSSNVAGGAYSFAAGRQAKALNDGSFVWADSQSGSFASTTNNQFLIRAKGGVGIGTASPRSALDVAGTLTANAFVGDGSGLSNVGSVSSLDASDGSPTHAVQVDGQGRVGIGTLTPSDTLHVTGTVRIEVGGTTITVGSDGKVSISAKGTVDIGAGSDINLSAGNDINISATHNLKLQGNNRIDLN